QVLDRAGLLAHDHDQHLALWVERPDVGPGVILLLAQSPVAGRGPRRVAPLPGRLVVGRARRPRIARSYHRVAGILDGADVGPDDAVHPDVEHLLGDPLALLTTVRWNADHRRHGRSQ